MWIKQYQTYSMGIAPDESGTTCSKNSEPRLYSATPHRAGILAGTFAGRRQAFLGGPWGPGTVGCGASKCGHQRFLWLGFLILSQWYSDDFWPDMVSSLGRGFVKLPGSGVRCEQCYERQLPFLAGGFTFLTFKHTAVGMMIPKALRTLVCSWVMPGSEVAAWFLLVILFKLPQLVVASCVPKSFLETQRHLSIVLPWEGLLRGSNYIYYMFLHHRSLFFQKLVQTLRARAQETRWNKTKLIIPSNSLKGRLMQSSHQLVTSLSPEMRLCHMKCVYKWWIKLMFSQYYHVLKHIFITYCTKK